MSEKVLRVEKLNVRFGEEEIIKNLSFEVEEGEILTIIGPNGSGKTTLLRALLGLIPYKGKIEWAPHVKIGYLPQRLSRRTFQSIPLSIEEFFGFKKVSRKQILEIFKLVGLGGGKKLLRRNPSELSSGEFQRMLIAWCLVDKPNVLLLDEPSESIDIGGEETIYSLLGKFWRERRLTILLVTHDLNIVYAYSSNVLCLCKKIFCYGPPKEILTPKRLQQLYGTKIKFYKHKHR